MSENKKANGFFKKQFFLLPLVFLCFLLLLFPLIANAYKINSDQLSIVSGEEMGSGSYTLISTIGQSIIGEVVSNSYLLQLGWVATILNNKPVVGQIQICDGTCSLAKILDPATEFTVRVSVTDIDGQGDVNTESFRVSLYTAGDVNSGADSWDHNNMTLMDDNLSLGTRNGCTQSDSVYCITIPNTGWSTKFLNGDANIYVAVDDNAHTFDANSMTAGGLVINPTVNISEDTDSGTYSGAPNTSDINFLSGQTGFSYVDTNHNGNINLDITIRAIDLNVSATVFIGDDNQSWHLTNMAADSTAFTGIADTVLSDWNRGIVATSDRNSQVVYTWLDVPNKQAVGDYTGTMTYNSSAT